MKYYKSRNSLIQIPQKIEEFNKENLDYVLIVKTIEDFTYEFRCIENAIYEEQESDHLTLKNIDEMIIYSPELDEFLLNSVGEFHLYMVQVDLIIIKEEY